MQMVINRYEVNRKITFEKLSGWDIFSVIVIRRIGVHKVPYRPFQHIRGKSYCFMKSLLVCFLQYVRVYCLNWLCNQYNQYKNGNVLSYCIKDTGNSNRIVVPNKKNERQCSCLDIYFTNQRNLEFSKKGNKIQQHGTAASCRYLVIYSSNYNVPYKNEQNCEYNFHLLVINLCQMFIYINLVSKLRKTLLIVLVDCLLRLITE